MECSGSCQGEGEDSGSVPGGEEQEEDIAQEPNQEEIWEAINQLNHNKAPGEDEITVEMLKLGGESFVQWLTRLPCRIWHSEEVPEDWLNCCPIAPNGSV